MLLLTDLPMFADLKSRQFQTSRANIYGRQINMLCKQGYFVSAERTDMGIMCAAPKGAGFAASFDHLQLDIG